MKSTSDSNHKNSTRATQEPLVVVKNFGLVFQLPYLKQQTVRESFVNFTKNPVEWIANKTEPLVIFEDLNFSVHAGDRIGFLGVNGTGKTSLCRCIAGIYHPTKGHIKAPKDVRAIFNTMVGIQPDLTGRENAELLIEFMFPQAHHDRAAILKGALEFSELGEFLNTPFKFYSNGMQARLCLSLISAKPSELLILDEVFDGADQFFRVKIQERIRKIIETSGAVIFVSHSTEQVLSVCNRVLVFNKGKIIFDGEPEIAVQEYLKMGRE